MQKMLKALLISCCFVCCTNSNTNDSNTKIENSKDSTATATANSTTVVTSCYAYIQNKDTIQLSITTSGNTFSGHMLYQLKEKDRNNGTLKGIIKGDTLIADYTFASEGMQSVRQVAFIKQQENLKEGFGESTLKNNQWVFKNPEALQFTGFLLTPAPCN